MPNAPTDHDDRKLVMTVALETMADPKTIAKHLHVLRTSGQKIRGSTAIRVRESLIAHGALANIANPT